jgi:hypothetical protein
VRAAAKGELDPVPRRTPGTATRMSAVSSSHIPLRVTGFASMHVAYSVYVPHRHVVLRRSFQQPAITYSKQPLMTHTSSLAEQAHP